MATSATDKLRRALQTLCPDDGTVCNQQLYEALGLTDEPAKARLRSRISEFVRRGELVRVDGHEGYYTYNREAMPRRTGESYGRIWRAIRASKPGWAYSEISQITRIEYTMVRRYCQWLYEEGYIVRHGKKGNTQLWRATQKARDQLRTPYPPIVPKDPFEAERSAACRLVRCLMEADPSKPRIKSKINKELQILERRFGAKEEAGDQ